jgi:hypothetical protein
VPRYCVEVAVVAVVAVVSVVVAVSTGAASVVVLLDSVVATAGSGGVAGSCRSPHATLPATIAATARNCETFFMI